MDGQLGSLQKTLEDIDRVLDGLFQERVSFDVISEYLIEETSHYDKETIWRLFILSALARIRERHENE